MASHKIERASEDIRRELTAIFRELKDPRVNQAFLSIVRVEVTNDLSYCTVYVSAIEGLDRAKEALKGLKSALKGSPLSMAGALLVKPALKEMLGKFDVSAYGGAPMLGLRGLVVKTHGNSTSVEIKNALAQCVVFKEKKINENIRQEMHL